MEYANGVLDFFNDFANFSKEKEIISFTDGSLKESSRDQNVTTPMKIVAISLVQK